MVRNHDYTESTMGSILTTQTFFNMLDLLEIHRQCQRDRSIVSAPAMIEMYVTPEKMSKDKLFIDVGKALGNSGAATIPTNESCRSSAYK